MAQAKIALLDPGRAKAIYARVALHRIRKDHIFLGEDPAAGLPFTTQAPQTTQCHAYGLFGVPEMEAGKGGHVISRTDEILDVRLGDLEIGLR